jgi:hypothetical protein
MTGLRYPLAGLLLGLAAQVQAADFEFDVGAYDKKPWQLTGYLSWTGEQQSLDTSAAFYTLNFGSTGLETNNRQLLDAEIMGQYNWTDTGIYFTLHGNNTADDRSDTTTLRALETYVAHQASTQMRYELGKRTLKWGKGYAWNPVGFVERAKDPLDPELSREGYVLADADYVKSGGGDLRTWGINAVLLPVDAQTNPEFGDADTYLAAKLYLLYLDNDIDFVLMNGANSQPRYGADFSRNLATNFEVHAEWSRSMGITRSVLQPDLSLATETLDADAWLLGLRYLTDSNLTTILELYHNGAGYSSEQMQAFYNEVASASAADLAKLRGAASASYGSAYTMRDYLYLRLIQKEPFDLIHWTPALTLIKNLDDGSYNAGAELVYTGIDDLELRLRLNLPSGPALTEFGEKPSDRRLELRLRYFY